MTYELDTIELGEGPANLLTYENMPNKGCPYCIAFAIQTITDNADIATGRV